MNPDTSLPRTPSSLRAVLLLGLGLCACDVPREPVELVQGGLNRCGGAISVNPRGIFWNDFCAGESLRAPHSGGAPVTLALSARPSAMRLDEESVYWISEPRPGERVQEVRRISQEGGTSSSLLSGQPSLSGLAVDASRVYWLGSEAGNERSNVLGATSKAGTGETQVLVSGLGNSFLLVKEAEALYWVQAEARPAGDTALPTYSIMRLPLAGGTPVALAAGQPLPGDLAVHGSSVYWIYGGYRTGEQDRPPGALMRVPVEGGMPEKLTEITNPLALVVDDRGISCVDGEVIIDSGFFGFGGTIRPASIIRLDHDGKNVETLVSKLETSPTSLTTYGGSVYWTSATGAVKRVDRD